MTPTDEKEDFVSTFVKRLQDLEPGERARFKRNAGLAMDEAHNVLGLFYKRLLYDRTLRDWWEEIYFLVATLFPFEKKRKREQESSFAEPTERPRNFGASLGQIRRSIKGVEGLDTRFERLLDADEQQMPFYLRREIQYLFNNNGRVDWERLLKDLLDWNHPDRWVQRTWARDYFSTPVQE
jgi:CRISPR system Cascade subunit CasB